MAEESCGFYMGVFLVVTGMIFIVGMGVYSIYNPLEVPACGEPEKLDNGEIVLSMADVDIPEKNQTLIFFTCNPGYKLDGPEKKVCEGSDWKPDGDVECKKIK